MKGKWFDQMVVVILENHGWDQVQSCNFVPWFAANGTTFTDWHGATHPSGPNYRTIFSGNPWSSNEFDDCWRPSVLDTVPNITISFAGTPADRHNPAKDMHGKVAKFSNNPNDPNDLVESIIYLGMDDDNDAHSGSIQVADANVMKAIDWWTKHAPQALLVVTFDEAFGIEYFTNRIFTGMAGPMVPKAKQVQQKFSHYDFAAGLFTNWNVDFHGTGQLPVCHVPWWSV